MRSRFLAVLLLPLLALSACGESDVTTHNDADITFLQAVHSDSGPAVATLLNNSSQSQQIRDIGGAIRRSQDRYTGEAGRLLNAWGVATPSYAEDPAVTALQTSTSFDSDAIGLLIERHEAIVAAARTELDAGENTEAIKIARDLLTARQSELGQLRALLAGDVRDYGSSEPATGGL